jgi:RimJ/RimL family protein N-acetyltransferase
MIILETERLLLREFALDDAAFIIELLSSPGWQRFIGKRDISTTGEAEKYIKDVLINSYRVNGFGLYAMLPGTDAMPIGMCGLVKRDTLADVDLGFAILPRFEGNGFTYEAAAAVMHFAFTKLKLRRLAAITVAQNTASISLLTKLGMNFTEIITTGKDSEELMLFLKSNE